MFFSSTQAPKNRYREWTRKRCQQLAPSRFIDITVIALQHNYTQIFTVRLFDRQLSENRNTVVKINLTHLYKERLKQRKKCCWIGNIGSPILLVDQKSKRVFKYLLDRGKSSDMTKITHSPNKTPEESFFLTAGKRSGGLRTLESGDNNKKNAAWTSLVRQYSRCYFRDCYVTLSVSMYVVYQGLRY